MNGMSLHPYPKGGLTQGVKFPYASLQELDDMLKEHDMKRDSVEINHDAPQWSHHAVWNRRYMEPKPGYTLEQLWADSEPAISKKTTTSYEVHTNDV